MMFRFEQRLDEAVPEIGRAAIRQMSSGLTHVARWLGKCPGCSEVVSEMLTSRDAQEHEGWEVETTRQLTCDCGHPFTVQCKMVRGKLTGTQCDDRCQSATGDDCQCACYGANHGVGNIWSFTTGEKVEKAAAARERRQAKLAAQVEAWGEEHQELAVLAQDKLPDDLADSMFVGDLWAQLHRKGELTDRQVEAGARVVRQIRERAAQQAEREANTIEVPVTGRVVVSGKVISTKTVEDDYTGGTTLKMLVEVTEANGTWRLYTTVPKALRDRETELEAGEDVRIKVNVTPRDRGFATGKRPSVA